MDNNQISTSEESYGHLRGVTTCPPQPWRRRKLPLGGVLKAQFQRGQSLVEVIVAVTIGILVVTALTFATIFSLRNANFAKNSEQATKLAQEGIERLRTGRDRNVSITGTGNFQIGGNTITSWNGDINGSGAIWNYQISPNCTPNCYFKVTSSGGLEYLTAAPSIPSSAEVIGQFTRVVVLSDDSNYQTHKTATVIVRWTDAAGPHDSQLTTILRKI